MSRNIVQNMNGSLDVKNEKFKIKGEIYYGATFTITLQQLEDDDSAFLEKMKITELIKQNS
jgi:hypothetical protein